jgi:hypothetical protein
MDVRIGLPLLLIRFVNALFPCATVRDALDWCLRSPEAVFPHVATLARRRRRIDFHSATIFAMVPARASEAGLRGRARRLRLQLALCS